MYTNITNIEAWKQSKGDKKLFAKILRNRIKKAVILQEEERLSNLKKMLAKGSITKEEYEEKTRKVIPSSFK